MSTASSVPFSSRMTLLSGKRRRTRSLCLHRRRLYYLRAASSVDRAFSGLAGISGLNIDRSS